MSLATWTWAITIVMCLFFLILSLRFKEKADTSFAHFAIAGGTLPFFLILFTDIATIMGVGNFVGHAAKGYDIGLSNIPFVVGEQGAKILFALVFAGFAARFTYHSIAEMMYDLLLRDKVSRALIGVLTASIMIAWIGGQAKGMGDLFAAFTGTNPLAMILVFSVVFIIYTTVGGIYSVVWTELIQGGLIIGLAIWFYFQVFAKIDFRFSTLQTKLNEIGASNLVEFNLSFGEVATLFITGCFGILAAQVYWQRCFAAKKPKAASRAMLYSGIVAIVFTCLATISGLVAKVQNPELDPNQAMPWLIMEEMTVTAALIFFTLIFLAAISSAASTLHSAAVVIINDLVIPNVPGKTDAQYVTYTRWCVLVVGVFAVAAALWASSIIGLFSMAYTMAGGGVIPVLIVGLLWKRRKQEEFQMGVQNSGVSGWGSRVGLLSGAICSIAFGILWGVLISTILTILVSLVVPTRHDRDLTPDARAL
ncbi:sodium:solute symporter family protein [Brevibacillus choshinensis]|uniref:sodium:solute symporter family protein n=1 Tax=Brevibacillus choshinensis TaxID=54911 RepID=UPI002E1E1CC0|nr:sodium:solute symporter family protein [Brevibacillus choshinensis]